MIRVRNGGVADLDALLALLEEEGAAGHLAGMTSLRPDPDFIAGRLAASEEAFATDEPPTDKELDYLFLLEDGDRVIGLAAIIANVGVTDPFYSYRIGTTVHASRRLGVFGRFQTLHLCNDFTGATEMASLFLHHDHHGSGAGRLLSLSRMLYLAEHPERFDELVFAEMRGFQDDDGSAPFWEGLGRRFISIPFPAAVRRVGEGKKAFIAELMPRHPIYADMLPESAQRAIGRVHPSTEPARQLLEAEGFWNRGYVDIFDGGPTIEARLSDIRAVYESMEVTIRPGDRAADDDPIIVATRSAHEFRAVFIDQYEVEHSDVLVAGPHVLAALEVDDRADVRITPARPGLPVL